MEFSADLIEGFALLSESLDDPILDLQAVLSVLGDDLAAAIPAFLGLTCTLHVEDNPVIITTLTDNTVAICSSLLFPLFPRRGGVPTGSMAFYSGTAGAFIDLAEDARGMLGPGWAPMVDGYLPAASGDPAGIRGLAELRIFNQAVGVLIEEGHTLSDAHTELRRRAGRLGDTVHEAALQLLSALTRSGAVGQT